MNSSDQSKIKDFCGAAEAAPSRFSRQNNPGYLEHWLEVQQLVEAEAAPEAALKTLAKAS
jgi:hypothetical protein